MNDEEKTKAQLIRELESLREELSKAKNDGEKTEADTNPGRIPQDVLNTIPVSIFWKDLKGRFLGCNNAFAAALGKKSPLQIIGRSDFDLNQSEFSHLFREEDIDIIESGVSKINVEEKIKNPTAALYSSIPSKFPSRTKTEIYTEFWEPIKTLPFKRKWRKP